MGVNATKSTRHTGHCVYRFWMTESQIGMSLCPRKTLLNLWYDDDIISIFRVMSPHPLPRQQGSWSQHGAHLGPVGPIWAPCWPYKPCCQGEYTVHWLPVNFRVQFQLLLQVYKALHGLAPSYLSSKLSLRPNKGLRSDNQLLLDVPKSTLQLKYYGDRAFSVAGPTLWNALPKEIRLCKSVDSFKSNLKTHFFKKAFAWFLNK